MGFGQDRPPLPIPTIEQANLIARLPPHHGHQIMGLILIQHQTLALPKIIRDKKPDTDR